MLNLLINKDSSISHKASISGKLQNAKEIYIAVAFLKKSALNIFLPLLEKGIHFEIVTGTNFGITEPDALTVLLRQMEQHSNIEAYLHKLDSKRTFHPKIYLIAGNKGCDIIVGSANLTEGGMKSNFECSLHYHCDQLDSVWIETKKYFKTLTSADVADPLSERIIALYRSFYKNQKKIRKEVQIEEFMDISTSTLYNLEKLKDYYLKLDKKKLTEDFKAKVDHYKQAREVLDTIANKKHNKKYFSNLIEDLVGKPGLPGLWYSNGMFRGKTEIFKQQEKFRELIKTIKSNINRSPQFVYDSARNLAKDIKRVGPNFIGEIMMTYAPNKLANINRNPITVLREEGGADIKSHSQLFNGKDYEEYNAIVKEIGEKLGLNNMLETDYFFNTI